MGNKFGRWRQEQRGQWMKRGMSDTSRGGLGGAGTVGANEKVALANGPGGQGAVGTVRKVTRPKVR